MVREAEEHAAEDARRREEAELKNRADNLAYAAERLLREEGERLPSDVKLEIENQTQALRQALEQNDILPVRRSLETLESALQRAQPVGATTSGNGQGSGAGRGPGTVEGEFREVSRSALQAGWNAERRRHDHPQRHHGEAFDEGRSSRRSCASSSSTPASSPTRARRRERRASRRLERLKINSYQTVAAEERPSRCAGLAGGRQRHRQSCLDIANGPTPTSRRR